MAAIIGLRLSKRRFRISCKTGWVRNAKQILLSTIKVIIRLVTRIVVDNGGKMGVLSTQIPESLLYWAFTLDNDFRDPVPGFLQSLKQAFLCRLTGRSIHVMDER